MSYNIKLSCLLLLVNLQLVRPQSSLSKVEYKLYDNDKEQQLQFFLGALKLCEAYDYEDIFGDRRYSNHNNSRGERIDHLDPCIRVVPFPFVSPLEYYVHLFEEDQRISANQTNAFKLRSLRKEIVTKYKDKFQSKLQAVDIDNLVSYGVVNATIQDYDFDTQKLRLSYSLGNINFVSGKHKINFPGLSEQNQVFYTHYISMKENQAEKIYQHYADLKPYSNSENPPFYLNTKTTFALRSSNDPKFKNQLHAVIKKVAFFIKEKEPRDLPLKLKHKDRIDEERKIGEIVFDQKVYLNRYKRMFQKVKE